MLRRKKPRITSTLLTVSIVPMVVEVLGGWNSEASFHFKEIAKKTVNLSDREVESVTILAISTSRQ